MHIIAIAILLGASTVSVDQFADGVNHYRNGAGQNDYARYSDSQIAEIANNILLYQRANGGWPPNWDPLRILSKEEKAQLAADKSKTDTSFDNRATYPQIEFLAQAFNTTGNTAYRDAALQGLEFTLKAQTACGGWPHSYPRTDNYRPLITFMDDVTAGVLTTLRNAAAGHEPFTFLSDELRARIARAVSKGTDCILRLQVVVNGEPTVWAGQYDPATLEPAQARTYELPSLVSAESVGVVRYLMGFENPSPEIVRAIECAVKWFDRSKIQGLRVEQVDAETVRYENHTSTFDRRAVDDPAAPPIWARFYEIDTNRPFMANRDGIKVYTLAQVDRERRTGYSWYGYYPKDLLEKDYPAWRARVK
ncbi:MAG: pectate lyase [Candidatus Hydrogenedentes bacterium]|nr:pectate lyase [Candidatus Hydrogenedentota bacterium]